MNPGIGWVDMLTVASAVVVGAGALAGGYQVVKARWNATVGLRKANKQLIDHLAVGMYRGYLIGLLGQPALAEGLPPSQQILRFDLGHAWVSTSIGPDDAVTAISITVLSDAFGYDAGGLSWGMLNGLVLGRSKYSSAAPQPNEGAEWALGARRTFYRELLYFGNPGMYQWYVLSSNDAGVMKYGSPPPSFQAATGRFASHPVWVGAEAASVNQPELDVYRAKSSPNTLTIVNWAGEDEKQFLDRLRRVELDWDTVRMFLRPTPAKSRRVQLRSRVHRWTRKLRAADE
jgi:hypothetical protein